MASTNRTGRVSAIDFEAGTYEVTYFARGQSVTRKINASSNGGTGLEQNKPPSGEHQDALPKGLRLPKRTILQPV